MIIVFSSYIFLEVALQSKKYQDHAIAMAYNIGGKSF